MRPTTIRRVRACRSTIDVPMSDPKSQDDATKDGPLKNFALLVLWLCVPGLVLGGVLAIISDLGDWDLAMGIGGSDIDVPKDRYAGFMLMVLGGILGGVLHFGGRVVDLVRTHRVPSLVIGAVVLVIVVLFGGRLVEALDGGPAVSAAMKGETDRLRAMFDAGEVSPDDHGRMLCWAAQNGDVPTLELLLARGVHPDATREDGTPAMKLACSYGGQDAVAVLRHAGSEVRCPRPPG